MADKTYKVYRYWIDLDGREWSYVGYTGQSLYDRAGGLTGRHYLNTSKFGFAIETYGWPNFKREILEDNLTEKEAREKEQFYIQKYNSINQGFNLSKGGKGNQGVHWSALSNQKNALAHGISGVMQYDLNNNQINQFNSVHEAGRQTGISYQAIWMACKGIHQTAGNYKWGYV